MSTIERSMEFTILRTELKNFMQKKPKPKTYSEDRTRLIKVPDAEELKNVNILYTYIAYVHYTSSTQKFWDVSVLLEL